MKARFIIGLLILTMLPLGLKAQTITYKGQTVQLGPKAFLVDANKSDAEAAASPYIFKTFNEAIANVTDGTPSDPMRVYIAPWVYWVDDPDDPEVRRSQFGGSPIGLYIKCESLQLLGMSEDARDVVLASARGQSQGSIGNFTMFDITGSDLVVKDLTLGNYCNIDLEYPRNPKLNRPKRNSAITQAQLAFCHGDRVYAENVRFMARLNLCPFNGSKRTLFVDCHFEQTDDSLNGTAVYLRGTFDYYGRQPFGSADRHGTVFLDSDFTICHGEPVQAVSKTVARHSLIDSRFHAGRPVYLAWTFRPEEWLRCYQYNLTIDGQPAFVGAAKPYNTVCLDQKAQLAAYRLVRNDGTVLYNTYNLLRGEDDWDPQGIRDEVLALGRRDHRDYASIPTCLDIDVREASIQTGEAPLTVTSTLVRHNGYTLDNQKVHWKVQPGYERFVKLSAYEGKSITVTAVNREDKTQVFDLIAYTEEGLEGAVQLTVAPDFIDAPSVVTAPTVRLGKDAAVLEYELELQGRADESVVTWYRSRDSKGKTAVPVSVSRMGNDNRTYHLTPADAGYYLSASVEPKHLRSNAGPKVFAPARKSAVKTSTQKSLSTDFVDFVCDNQPEVIPGFWTVDAFKPEDTADYTWSVDMAEQCWIYGTGINGAKGYGIQPVQQGARLRYTPVKGNYGDMSVTWQVDPAKDGGQGFASARQQYLDLFIKFDTKTLTGYALRVIRTTKYANAVDVLLVRYDHGSVTPISESVSTDCFLTGCVLSVKAEGTMLSAHVEGPGRIADLAGDPKIHHSVDLQARISPNAFGGLGLQHTSTVGTESRILVHSLKAEWK